jgi:hypothetical protein
MPLNERSGPERPPRAVAASSPQTTQSVTPWPGLS